MNVIDGAGSGKKTTLTIANPTIEVSTYSNRVIYPDTSLIPWMRYLYIEFTNEQGEKISVGGYDDSLEIEVDGTKTLASAGDTATIKVYNLPLAISAKIINQGYTKSVKIDCGYYNTNHITVFDGGVCYVEEAKSDKNTSILTLECATRFISDKLQARMPIALNSGFNLYRCVEEVARAYGVEGQIEIDECLKDDILNAPLSQFNTLSGWIEGIINASSSNKSYAIITSGNSLASIAGYKKIGSGDTYVINTNSVNLQTLPTISSEGLKILVSPIYNMKPGDIFSIDNTITAWAQSESDTQYIGAYKYLDKDGLYNIRQIKYRLTNRSNAFYFEVLGISKSLMVKLMNGESKEQAKEEAAKEAITGGKGGRYTK